MSISTPATSPAFVHLRVHTAYSLLEGACQIKSLIKKAAAQSMPALGIADTDNLFGSLEFSSEAASAGIQPIIGVLLHFRPPVSDDRRNASAIKGEQLFLIAKDVEGYENLLSLASRAYVDPAGGIAPLLDYEHLDGLTTGVICLTAGRYGGVGQRLLAGQEVSAQSLLSELETRFPGHLYIELMRHHLAEEKILEGKFLQEAVARNLPLVATNDIYFFDEAMYEAHDALRCIAQGRYLSEPDRARLNPHFRFKNMQEMTALFADLPEALENTVAIARRCSTMSPKRAPILPRFGDGSSSEDDILRERGRAGLEYRLENYVFTAEMDDAARAETRKTYSERLEFELDVICKMQFPGYFLIVSDFITWSKENDIPVGPGRGSGAGSLVAWSLLITDLDPLRYGLLFERFLNPERVSMPDFDVDFCQDRRNEVITYVQQKYGRDQVAQIITFGTLQARAALRDVGRVLQLPYGLVDRTCKLVPNNPAQPTKLAEAIEIEPLLKQSIQSDEQVKLMVDIALKLEGLYRHASVHAAGVVIADRPLQQLVPLYRDPGSDMPVVQYSMKYAELAGLVKFDFLGLKTLTVLQQAVRFVQRKGITLDLLKLPEGDAATYSLLGKGEASGVFQLESAGMRDTLRKLKPDSIEDIIALVSLYRPGPMSNIPTYIARKHGHEVPQYPHPDVEEILKETYGVIIYQEQVMQIAQKLAGYSLGQADLLRRAMGKKIRSEMEAQRELFVNGATERGVKKNVASGIFDLMAKFAEYGFNKSHAAAYALIAYQTAYLKANFTTEFLAASMNYDMHNTDKLAMFREEAGKFGIAVLPPDVNRSHAMFEVELQGPDKDAIRYGLAAIRNVGAAAMEAMVEERDKNGPFRDMFDFAERVDARVLNRRQMEHLIKAGAFDSIYPNRKQLMIALEMVLMHGQAFQRDKESQQESLFGIVTGSDTPIMERPKLPQGEDWRHLEKLEKEFEAIGFYLSAHPISDYQEALNGQGVLTFSSLPDKLSDAYTPITLAGIVMGKKVRVSDRGRFAFLSLSDPTGLFEVAIYDEQILNAQGDLMEPGQLLIVHADGKTDESGPRLIARQLQLMEKAIQQKAESGGGRQKPTQCCITLDSADAIEPLKRMFGDAQGNGGGTQIMLKVSIHGSGWAMVKLPAGYKLSKADIEQFSRIPGVLHTESKQA